MEIKWGVVRDLFGTYIERCKKAVMDVKSIENKVVRYKKE